MHDVADPPLDAETIRRFASEQVKITLTENEIDALKTTLNGLLDEIRLMTPSDRKAAEPETGVIVQDWPS